MMLRNCPSPVLPPEISSAPSLTGHDIAAGLRIALFSGNYNCVRDGANKALNKLVAFLLEQGAAVRVYSPTVGEPAFEPAGDLVSVPSFPIPARAEYRVALGVTSAVEADIRAFQPTHVHLSAPDLLGWGALRLAQKMQVPIVTSLHTMFETYLDYYRLGFLSKWVRLRLKSFYSQSDYVLAPNAALAGRLISQEWASRVGIWGRGVNHEIFSPERRSAEWRIAQGFAEDELVILFFGRLVPEKGLDMFCEVVRELERRNVQIRPMVIGDGPSMGRLRAQLPRAVFTGHLEGAELGRAVASADILINPSVTEAFGNVNLEAMAAGLAIVSADVDSAAQLIVTDEHGLLVDPAKSGAYVDAVKRLVDSADLRKALGRQAHVESRRHVWSTVLESVVHAYRLAEAR